MERKEALCFLSLGGVQTDLFRWPADFQVWCRWEFDFQMSDKLTITFSLNTLLTIGKFVRILMTNALAPLCMTKVHDQQKQKARNVTDVQRSQTSLVCKHVPARRNAIPEMLSCEIWMCISVAGDVIPKDIMFKHAKTPVGQTYTTKRNLAIRLACPSNMFGFPIGLPTCSRDILRYDPPSSRACKESVPNHTVIVALLTCFFFE